MARVLSATSPWTPRSKSPVRSLNNAAYCPCRPLFTIKLGATAAFRAGTLSVVRRDQPFGSRDRPASEFRALHSDGTLERQPFCDTSAAAP